MTAPCSTSPDDWFTPSRYAQAAAVCFTVGTMLDMLIKAGAFD